MPESVGAIEVHEPSGAVANVEPAREHRQGLRVLRVREQGEGFERLEEKLSQLGVREISIFEKHKRQTRTLSTL